MMKRSKFRLTSLTVLLVLGSSIVPQHRSDALTWGTTILLHGIDFIGCAGSDAKGWGDYLHNSAYFTSWGY